MPDASGPITSPSHQRTQRVRKILVADLFCGAGGTSTGAKKAIERLGHQLELVCVNHWPVAIETHTANMPQARHHCVDLETAKPDEIVPEGYLDILMASPTCTHHSRARGGKPTEDQMRMDPWTIVRWLSTLKVKFILIENVIEFIEWGPIDPRTGTPLKSKKGQYFKAWLNALAGLGYRCEWRYQNAADFGDATTRQRFILVGTLIPKTKVPWPQQTHAPSDKALLLGLEPWKPAKKIIDWTNRGKCIFKRPRPLKPKTLRRIYVGVQRHFGAMAEIYKPALELEIIRSCNFYKEEPNKYIPNPKYVSEPDDACLIELRGTSTAHSIKRPLPTFTAGGTHLAVINARPEPFIISQASGGAPRSTEEPVPTIPTGGAHALVNPQPFIIPNFGERPGQMPRNQSIDNPLPTVTSHGAGGVVTPDAIVIHLTHDGERKVLSTEDPLPTITCAHRGELGLVSRDMVPTLATPETEQQLLDAAERRLLVMENNNPSRLIILELPYRMLTKEELGSAMSFHTDEAKYIFHGTTTEIIKQIGNAVPVELARAHVGAIATAL